jgi:hypothetical protein
MQKKYCRHCALLPDDKRTIGKTFCNLRHYFETGVRTVRQSETPAPRRTKRKSRRVWRSDIELTSAAEMLTVLQQIGVRRHLKNKSKSRNFLLRYTHQ